MEVEGSVGVGLLEEVAEEEGVVLLIGGHEFGQFVVDGVHLSKIIIN